jgi:integrase/recombinase XerD
MSALSTALENYLALRRSMGFKLTRTGKLLAQFIAYCEAANATTITIELAVRWATLPGNGKANWVAYRLSAVRGFAKHLALLDECTEVTPANLLPSGSQRATPYLYSENEVLKLMVAAGRLRSPLRRATLSTLVGLLWVTGMRIGEALRLDRQDVNLVHGILVVRDSKFGKSRELPIRQSTTEALRSYAKRRDELCPHASSPAFFVSLAGTRLRYDNFHLAFLRLLRGANIARRWAGPRPHDLRHSFAVRTLIDWYRDYADVESRLPQLSTYLGHVHPANTYWYLSAAPELLGLAANRLERGTEVPL